MGAQIVDQNTSHGVRLYAQNERDKLYKKIQEATLKTVCGSAAVEAVATRLEKLLPDALASGNISQIEDTIQQAKACSQLAGLRGVAISTQLKKSLEAAVLQQQKHEANCQATLVTLPYHTPNAAPAPDKSSIPALWRRVGFVAYPKQSCSS